MTERCETCAKCYRLEKCDYSQGGCTHTDMAGYICMAFADEGMACWMYGIDETTGFCEAYTPKK